MKTFDPLNKKVNLLWFAALKLVFREGNALIFLQHYSCGHKNQNLSILYIRLELLLLSIPVVSFHYGKPPHFPAI